MAEYYAVLKKAVGGLEPGAAESRRVVYDKARNALIGQLKAIDPPLPPSEISRQRLELEEAIRRVERETAAESQNVRPQRPPVQHEAPPPAAHEPPPPPLQPPSPQAARASQPSPQDVFRRAVRQAEARGAPAAVERAAPAPAPAPERAAGQGPGTTQYYASYGPNVRTSSEWNQVHRSEPPRAEPRPEPRPAPAPPSDSRLAPDYDAEPAWQAPPMASDPYVDRRDRPAPEGRRKAYVTADDDAEPFERAPRRSRLPTILLLVLIFGMIAGLGALAWSQRALIADLVADLDGSGSESAPQQQTAAPPANAGKEEGRLTEAEPDPSVRVVGEPQSPPESGEQAASDPIADAISGAPRETTTALPPGAQKAVLYEEPLDAATAAAGVTAIDAAVTWRFVESGANGPEIEANIEIPERSMNVRVAIRRNIDASLPASHLVETVIRTPADFPGRGVRGVPRLVLKENENDRGEPLVGATAQVDSGIFWIALSAAGNDVTHNLRLLRDRDWVDLPIVYESGQRAILTFEKGDPGKRAFEQAFAAWETG